MTTFLCQQFFSSANNLLIKLLIMTDATTLTELLLILSLLLLIAYIFNYYFNVSKYPKGPFPLPFVGNLYQYRGQTMHDMIINWSKIHGGVFTFWLGRQPVVVLASMRALNEAYKQKRFDFDRNHIQLAEVILRTPSSADVIVSASSIKWEYLRKISHRASNKFAASETLPKVIIPIVDQLILDMKNNIGRPFSPSDKLSTLIYCILASMISGIKMDINDKSVSDIMKSFLIQVGISHKLLLIESMPTLRWTLFRYDWNRLISAYRYVSDWCYQHISHMMSNIDDIQVGVSVDMNCDAEKISSFSDELIKQKIELEKKDAATDFVIDKDDMTNVAMNMFVAGSNSTSITLSWAFLFMCKYPEMQTKIRNEIYSNISEDADPNAGHMKMCNYVMAFISEILRLCPVLPLSLPHVTTRATNICGKDIPKGTRIIQSLISPHRDAHLFPDPEKFDPQRFIDQDGIYDKNIPGYVPFSMGHRLCIGERIAYINLFIILSRILQKTKGYKFCADNADNIDTSPDPKYFEYKPKYFEVKLIKE